MTRQEHLLIIAMEECSEVAHRISKALRFTINEVQPGQDMNNGERIMQEYCDLLAGIEMLQEEGILPKWSNDRIHFQKEAKKSQVEKYLKYSDGVGTLK